MLKDAWFKAGYVSSDNTRAITWTNMKSNSDVKIDILFFLKTELHSAHLLFYWGAYFWVVSPVQHTGDWLSLHNLEQNKKVAPVVCEHMLSLTLEEQANFYLASLKFSRQLKQGLASWACI